MIRLHVVAERTFLTDPSNSVVFEFRLDTTKTNVNSTVTMKFDETLILGGSERAGNLQIGRRGSAFDGCPGSEHAVFSADGSGSLNAQC